MSSPSKQKTALNQRSRVHRIPFARKNIWDTKKIIQELPVFQDQKTWQNLFQQLVSAQRLVAPKCQNDTKRHKKALPKDELLLQIIHRRLRQLLPPSSGSAPLHKVTPWQRARLYWMAHADELEKLEYEIQEIKEWLFESGEERSDEQFRRRIAGLLFDHGLTVCEISEVLEKVQLLRRPGRPSKWKLAAVEAETLYRKGEMNWLQITRTICPCGSRTHTPHCRNNFIYPRVKELRRMLIRLSIAAPTKLKGKK